MTPYELIPCTPTFTAYKQVFDNWTPLIDQGMDLTTALAESCDTYFYELGKRFYTLAPNRGHPLQGWANRFGLGEPTGIDIKPETSGLIPTPEWLKDELHRGEGLRRDRPDLEAGLLDPDGDRPGPDPGHAAADGAPLRDDRERRQARDAAPGRGRRAAGRHRADRPRPAPLRRRSSRSRPASIRPRSQFVREGLLEGAQSKVGTSFGVFGNFPVSISGKTGTAEKPTNVPGFPHPLDLSQSWWCGYGPTDSPSIVVCAVIENGGHGGTSAAPAALKVFEQYFGKQATTTAHPSD